MGVTITLDAGHSGNYNRSPVNSNYFESNNVWNIVESLAPKLEKAGFTVIKTRSNKDVDLELTQRGKKSKGSQLFISFHTNACGTESVDRVEAIVLSPNNSTNIDEISNDIGVKLCEAVRSCIGATQSSKVYSKLSTKDRDKNGKLDDEYFGVLEGAREVGVPALILECGFHTNKKTTDWFLTPGNIDKLTDKLCSTLVGYFGLTGVTPTPAPTPVPTPTPTPTPAPTPTHVPTPTPVNKDEGVVDKGSMVVNSNMPMTVKVLNDATPVFKGTEFNSEIYTTVNKNEIYTVTEKINSMYKLKSGVGYLRVQDVKIYDINKQKNPFKPPTRTLKYGCVGEDVQWLKFELLQYGLGQFNYDNKNFYEQVDIAVKQYQKMMGLVVDGIVGEKTRNSLINDNF